MDKQTIFSNKVIILHSLIFLFLLAGCSLDDTSCSSALEESIEDYKKLHDCLYKDEKGQLYFRVLDRSAADNPACPESGLVYRYNKYVLVDTIIDGEETFVDRNINDVVDEASFRLISLPDSADYSTHYTDKYHRYILYQQADGGVLHAYGLN